MRASPRVDPMNPDFGDCRSLYGSRLAKRAIRGVIRVQIVLALLLFVPAGSLRFWEAWLYWILFSVSVLVITLHLLQHDPALVARRMQIGPGAESRMSQKIVQWVAGVLCAALYLAPGFDHRLQWSTIPTPAVLVAIALVMFGLWIVFRALKDNSYAAGTVRVEADQQVVSSGLYAWIRHPMYLGSFLGFLATPLALGSLWALLPAILLCAVVVVRLLDEEQHLSENLPGYDAYCRKVRYRLIPAVW